MRKESGRVEKRGPGDFLHAQRGSWHSGLTAALIAVRSGSDYNLGTSQQALAFVSRCARGGARPAELDRSLGAVLLTLVHRAVRIEAAALKLSRLG